MNDLEKEFVPYQQSIDMKELGFDEPCFGYYEDNNLTTTFPSTSENGWKWVGNAIIPVKNTKAPLYQQAFRWFREKYELYSFVAKWDEGFSYETYKEGVTQTNDSFDTYKEAELACLIKLIELTKSGSLKA